MEAFIAAICTTEVDWAFVPPVVIDALAESPDLLATVQSRLKYLFFTGGSVPKASGDVVAQKLPIWQVLGSSECASLPLVHPIVDYRNAEDWNYVQINPLLKSEMCNRLDDLHELVIKRNVETEPFQPVFAHFPDTNEYPTRDLFRQHPSKSGLWAYQSRIDDIIVFINGEKTNPVTFEEEVSSHPEVKSALVFGAQRMEAGLLVELSKNEPLSFEEQAAAIDRIWPVVEKANKAAPAHARISKSKILLANPEAPMLRAGKGTVQRAATLSLYADDIEKLYLEESPVDGTTLNLPSRAASTKDDIKSTIRDLVAEILDIDDLDFFQMGMDSLGVLRLQRAIKKRFPGVDISPNSIYSKSSVNGLANALENLAANEEEVLANVSNSTKELERMLKTFTQDMDRIDPVSNPALPVTDSACTILLTGSTGALGSYILHRLLSRVDIAHIYCLDRTADAMERLIKNNTARNLNTQVPFGRVTFLCGNLADQSLGLSANVYQTLLSQVTHVIHNAWPVNFNLPLSAFGPSLSGIVSLARFSARSRRNSSIQFFSSISNVSSFPGATVPEAVIHDMSASAEMGYGQAKYLAERLLDHASKTLKISASVIRIGQIAGAAQTATGWNRQEWLPSLVASSAFIKALPETLGDAHGDSENINWIPIDHLADVAVELTLDSENQSQMVDHGMPVFQVVHPKPIPWSSVVMTIKDALEDSQTPNSIGIVPFDGWISAIKETNNGSENPAGDDDVTLAHQNPALKLLPFYESLRHQGTGGLRKSLCMEKTLDASKILKDLQPLKDEWITGWVKEWVDAHAE
jgi:thioester reductase-like protein/acyl carrier protein